jgi:hypothetical protein
VLRTRISPPVNRTTYGRAMCRHILTEQLQVSEEEFWAFVDDGQPPPRGATDMPVQAAAIPASLVYRLIHEVGLSEEEISRLTRTEAIDRMQAHWSRPQ